ncbi:MAG: 2-hydroxy-6-oxonona-2,4-dienedioate hydrolase [Rhodothermales bacterium]|jgi:2-hydroxy-6-oxonona-2,4-dienedioate hydrolase
MTPNGYTIHSKEGYRFADEGPGPGRGKGPVLLLHGMLGEVSNWTHTIRHLEEDGYRVLVPVLPVYAMPTSKSNVPGLVDYVVGFLDALGVPSATFVGNSLGGHIAIKLALGYPERVHALVLSGASGLYELDMGQSSLRRKDREYLRERAAVTFYEPRHVTEEMVDDVYRIVNDRARALRLIRVARSVKAENVRDDLHTIGVPTLLVWGREDEITPPDVGLTFEKLIPASELHWIDACGHAPMLERPAQFNEIILDFLRRTNTLEAVA